MAKKTHRSGASLLISMQRRYEALQGTALELLDKSARETHQDLHKLTSGQLKTDQLRAMGHPYGRGARPGAKGKAQRGGGRVRVSPWPINQQTGKLRRSIYLKQVGRHRYRIGASAPYAKHQFSPDGTKRMVRRDVMGGRRLGGRIGQLERRWRARLKGIRRNLKRAYETGNKQRG